MLQGAAELCRWIGLGVQVGDGQCLEVSPGSQSHQAGQEWCLPRAGPGEWAFTELCPITGTWGPWQDLRNGVMKAENLIKN